MRIQTSLVKVGLTVALMLACAATASASRSLSTRNTGVGIGTTALTLQSEEYALICALTLRGSLHAAFAKTRGALAGFFNERRVQNCRSSLGGATFITVLLTPERPWHLAYESFGGTLPRISEVLFTIKGFGWLVLVEGVIERAIACLIGGNVPIGTAGTTGASEYTIRSLTVLANALNLVAALEEEIFTRCPERWEVRARFTTLSEVTLRLV